MSLLEFLFWFTITGYFAYTSFVQGQTQAFISLTPDAGNCQVVPKQVTLQQYVSLDAGDLTYKRGIWSSSPRYEANSTAYSMTLTNYLATETEFVDTIFQTSEKLGKIADVGVNRGLPWNLIVWTTFSDTRSSSAGTGEYSFSLAGEVNTVFNAPAVYAQISNRDNGMCEMAATSAVYDVAANSYVLTIKDYFDNSTVGKCPQHLDAAAFGIQSYTVNKYYRDFQLRFDMRSISIALAVNMGQIPISELSRVQLVGSSRDFAYEFCSTYPAYCLGMKVVDWAAFTSVRYAGMDPLNCVGTTSQATNETRYFCFVRIGRMVLYPLINHYELCDCDAVANDETYAAKCNEQNILPSLIYYPFETVDNFPQTLFAVSFLRVQLFGNPYADNYLNNATWPASRLTISGAYGAPNITKEEVQDALGSLCVGTNPCSLIVFQSKKTEDFAINGFAFQLPNAACSKSIYCEDCMNELSTNIPFSLTEDYLTCVEKVFNNFILSVGISTGNASIFTQIILFLLTFLLGQYLKIFFGYVTDFGNGPDVEKLKEKREVRYYNFIYRFTKQMLTLIPFLFFQTIVGGRGS